MKCGFCLLVTLFTFSALITIIGIVAYLKFSDLFEYRLKREINLRNGSELFPKWQRTPVPIDYKVYILEVINPRRVVEGDKPIVRERGPFHFTEYRRKEVLGYSPDGRTVKYKEYREYYFDRSKSNYSLDRKVTFVNVPVVTIATRITEFLNQLPFQPLTRPIVNGAITALLDFHNQNLFTKRTVRELLFEGYRVNVLDTIRLISMPLKLIGINIPHIPLINNTFGVFHNKNGTADGPFEVHTGIGDYTKIGQFVTWKAKKSLNYWKGSTCNILNGTDGFQFSPFIQKDDTLTVFIFEACRSFLLGFDRETEVKGIKTLRFKTLPQSFRSAKKNSHNWCYCNKLKKQCNYDGLIDISPCWFNAPIYASNPHFYNASKSIISKIKGLKPDEDKHVSFADIEPTTGTVLRGQRRFELNVEIKNFSIISNARNILRPAIIPILWVDEGSQLSDELRDELKLKLFTVKMFAEIGIKVLIAIGFTLLSIFLVIVFCKKGRNNALNSELNSSVPPTRSKKQAFISWIRTVVNKRNLLPNSFRSPSRPPVMELPLSESGSETSVTTITSNVSMEPSTFGTRRQSVSVLKSNDLLSELKQIQKTSQKDENSNKPTNEQLNSTKKPETPSQSQTEPKPFLQRRASIVNGEIPQKSSKILKKQMSLNNIILPPLKAIKEEKNNNGIQTQCHGLQKDSSVIAPVEVIPKIYRIDDRRMSLHF